MRSDSRLFLVRMLSCASIKIDNNWQMLLISLLFTVVYIKTIRAIAVRVALEISASTCKRPTLDSSFDCCETTSTSEKYVKCLSCTATVKRCSSSPSWLPRTYWSTFEINSTFPLKLRRTHMRESLIALAFPFHTASMVSASALTIRVPTK